MSVHQQRVLPGIQLLRGLTSCLVVLAHANLIMGHKEEYGTVLLPIRLSGMFAVSVFFVISGFIIAAVSLDEQWNAKLSKRSFVTKRFVRIIPFMWVCIIGYNILSAAATRHVEWPPFLRAMTLWPVGELKPNTIWSLQHEAIFYALFAISFLCRKKRAWVLAAWVLAPFAYVACSWAAGLDGGQSATWRDLTVLIILGGFSGANAQFGAGLLLGLAYVRRPDATTTPFAPRLDWTVIVALLAAAACFIEWTDYAAYGIGRMSVWTLLAALLVWLGVALPQPGRAGRAFRLSMLLGDASFSIYLVHSATLMVLFFVARKMPAIAYAVPILTLALTCSLAIGSGIVAHILIERPIIKWLTAKVRVRPPASALDSTPSSANSD